MRNLLFTVILLFWTLHNSQARYATKEEAPAEIEFQNITVEIEKDGKLKTINEVQLHILNEIGREKFGTSTFHFTDGISEIKILEAKTIDNGIEYLVPAENIEIKPLASSEKGFDQKYQILVSYPNARVGSSLYVKYQEYLYTPPVDNHFAETFDFGVELYSNFAKVHVISNIEGLKYKINDPIDSLVIEHTQNDGIDDIIITQKKPLFFHLINEPKSEINHRDVPSVRFSSNSSYEELGKYFAPKYEAVVKEKLPEVLSSILSGAKKIEDENAQIDYITSEIAQKIRYMGSWQTLSGKLFPRSLALISESGYADCKEYASSTAAIMNQLGYKSSVAIVKRGSGYIQYEDLRLPGPSNFNHAIVYAISPSGKEYWIDPTNFESMSGHIFSDISGRPALILDSKNPKLKFTPKVTYETAKEKYEREVSFFEGKIIEKGIYSLFGQRAKQVTGLELKTSRSALEEILIRILSGEIKPQDYHVTIPDLKSRIVRDTNFIYDFTKDEDLFATNLGKALILKSINEPWFEAFLLSSLENKGVVYLGDSNTLENKYRVKNYKAASLDNINFTFSNKWFDISRKAEQEENDIFIEEKLILKESILYPEDQHTDIMRDIKHQIKSKIGKTIIVGEKVISKE